MAEIEKEETMTEEEVTKTAEAEDPITEPLVPAPVTKESKIQTDETVAEEFVEEAEEAQATEPAATATKEKKSKKKDKKAKPNFFVRLGRRLAKFFRDYNSERKKITWKPWREVCKSAGIVVVTVAAFSLAIYAIDEAFGNLFLWLAGIIG